MYRCLWFIQRSTKFVFGFLLEVLNLERFLRQQVVRLHWQHTSRLWSLKMQWKKSTIRHTTGVIWPKLIQDQFARALDKQECNIHDHPPCEGVIFITPLDHLQIALSPLDWCYRSISVCTDVKIFSDLTNINWIYIIQRCPFRNLCKQHTIFFENTAASLTLSNCCLQDNFVSKKM